MRTGADDFVENTVRAAEMYITTLCNTAKSLLGTLNRNTQQSDEGEHKPKKRKQQQQANSSDDADQY